MGVPLLRGLRCQGIARCDEDDHCPSSGGWRKRDRGGGGRGCEMTEVQFHGQTQRTGDEEERGPEEGSLYSLTPTGDKKICGE